MAHEVAVGIDLGTEFSVVSVLRKGKVEVLCNDDGYRKTPSVVAFWGDERYVGSAALDLDWSRVFDVKRLIGRRWGDINIQCMRKFSSFDVVEQNGILRIQVLVSPGKRETFAPEEISAMVIRNLKETAELALEQTVTKAVITVPAYFNDRQRQATKNAGKIAGLDVLGIISEPTAVAIAYGLNNVSTSKRTAVIFDLGGDTFDVSVMAINGSEFRILASDGDTHLGRRDFELRLLSYFLQDIRKRHRLDLEVMKDSVSIHELSNNCKLLRRKLCSLPQATISLFLSKHSLPYRNQITRELFENLCMDLFKKVRATTVKVLMSSGVAPRAVDDVVLVGVATRIPKVRALLSALFGAEKLRYSLEADQVVSRGAAMHADALTRALGPRM